MAALGLLLVATGRLLARLLGFLLVVLLALGGLAAAIFSIEAGPGGLSLPHLADLVKLPGLRDQVSSLLSTLEGSGFDALAALGGLIALLLGALLLVGVFAGRRERSFTASDSEEGRTGARRGALADGAEQLASEVDGVTAVRARARPGRRGGGKVRVEANHSFGHSADPITRAVDSALTPIRQAFGARTSVRARPPSAGKRVE